MLHRTPLARRAALPLGQPPPTARSPTASTLPPPSAIGATRPSDVAAANRSAIAPPRGVACTHARARTHACGLTGVPPPEDPTRPPLAIAIDRHTSTSAAAPQAQQTGTDAGRGLLLPQLCRNGRRARSPRLAQWTHPHRQASDEPRSARPPRALRCAHPPRCGHRGGYCLVAEMAPAATQVVEQVSVACVRERLSPDENGAVY